MNDPLVACSDSLMIRRIWLCRHFNNCFSAKASRWYYDNICVSLGPVDRVGIAMETDVYVMWITLKNNWFLAWNFNLAIIKVSIHFINSSQNVKLPFLFKFWTSVAKLDLPRFYMIVLSETFHLLPRSSKLDLAFKFYEVNQGCEIRVLRFFELQRFYVFWNRICVFI